MARDIPRPLNRAYAILSGDDSTDRMCDAIPDEACTEVPRNYLLNVANGMATKLAEQLASPQLVLPWLLAAIGAPAAFAGLTVPVRQAGALLPQLAAAARIRALARRKWAWSAAGATQAAALGLMIPAALLPPAAAGGAIVALLAVFSVASGIGSVAFQDVTGKTIPRGRRGIMLSNRAMIGGGLTIAAALLLKTGLGGGSAVVPYLALVAAASFLWLAAAVAFAAIEEVPGATGGGRNATGELRAALRLFRETAGFRRFLLVRALLVAVELATPFLALHARTLFGGAAGMLGTFVFAVGLANMVSSPVWGRFADRSSRKVMATGGIVGGVAGVLALSLGGLPETWQSPWLYALAFVLIGMAEGGVRLGRKTYLVDAAPPEDRPLYVAFSNTAIGLVVLVAGGLGLLAPVIGVDGIVALLAALSLAGAAAASGMPEAERMAVA